MAVEKGNVEIVKLLLANNKININCQYILNKKLSIKFKIKIFNAISIEIFQSHYQRNISIIFQLNF